jgi:hypothetical protein
MQNSIQSRQTGPDDGPLGQRRPQTHGLRMAFRQQTAQFNNVGGGWHQRPDSGRANNLA